MFLLTGCWVSTAEVFDRIQAGVDTATQETVSSADLLHGDLIITEVMANPTVCGTGEWVEITNNTRYRVNLAGVAVSNQAFESGTILGEISIAPLKYAVLAQGSASSWCGQDADPVAYYGDVVLSNGAEQVIVWVPSNGVTVDAGAEFSEGAADPGVSLQLDRAKISADENDLENSWCPSTGVLESGERGTPGVSNDACAGP